MEIVIGLAVIGFAGWWFFFKDKESSATPDAPQILLRRDGFPHVNEIVQASTS